MSHRKFSDRNGRMWEVRVSSKHDWGFEPVSGNPETRRSGAPPLYAGDDPFELSEQELQQILDDARPLPGGARSASGADPSRKSSPFRDDYEAPKKPSPFGDDQAPPKKQSPFLDDR